MGSYNIPLSTGIRLFSGYHVSEALALQTTDIKSGAITISKSTTKGKHKTRIVDIPKASRNTYRIPAKTGGNVSRYARCKRTSDPIYGRQDGSEMLANALG
jgi:integrase